MPLPPKIPRASQALESLAPPATQDNGYLLLVAREVDELKLRVTRVETNSDLITSQHQKIRMSHAAIEEEQGQMLARLVTLQKAQDRHGTELEQVMRAVQASRAAAIDASVQAAASRDTQTTKRTSWGQTLLLAALYLAAAAIKELFK